MHKYLHLFVVTFLFFGCKKEDAEPEIPEYKVTYVFSAVEGTFSIKYLDSDGNIVSKENLGSAQQIGAVTTFSYEFTVKPGDRVYMWAKHDGNAIGSSNFNTVHMHVDIKDLPLLSGGVSRSGAIFKDEDVVLEKEIDAIIPEAWPN